MREQLREEMGMDTPSSSLSLKILKIIVSWNHGDYYLTNFPLRMLNFAKSSIMRVITMREAIREAMIEEMKRDERVFLMGEEVAQYDGAYKVSKGMLQMFGPKRVIDTPISELGFAAIGIGAALNGLRPIVEFMTWNFAILAADQIINTAAKMLYMSGGQFNVPIVFRGPNGFAGQLSATHSQSFESMYSHIPGLKVVSPSNPYDAKGLLKSAIRDDDPVLFLEAEILYNDKGEVPEEEYLIPIGKAKIVREGSDVTLVSFNKTMKLILQAADELAKESISAEVIDLRTIRPMDYQTVINSVKKTNRLVIVTENWPLANVGDELTYMIQKEAFDYLDAPVRCVTTADTPAPYSSALLEFWFPNIKKVINAAKEVLYLL